MSVNVESPKTFNVTPNRAPVSLKEVMDEELAHKLQSEQSPVQVQIYEENLSKEEDIDEDLRLALELSAKEAQERESLNVNSNSSPVSAPSTAESVNSSTSLQSTSPAAAQLDEDFLFALIFRIKSTMNNTLDTSKRSTELAQTLTSIPRFLLRSIHHLMEDLTMDIPSIETTKRRRTMMMMDWTSKDHWSRTYLE